MIAVSDTGPILYLHLVDQLWILPTLFGTVAVPRAVYLELSAPGAPSSLQSQLSREPSWVRIVDPTPSPKLQDLRLGAGELAALAVCLSERQALMLCDDRAARLAAGRLGVDVTGTLGLLSVAAQRGLIDLKASVQRLTERTNFRYSRKLVDALLRESRSD